MKKIYHIINLVLSILIAGLGVILMISPSEMLIEPIAGGMAIVLSIIYLIIGAFFPKEEQQKVIETSPSLDERINSTPESIQMIEGRKKLRRSWEPSIPFLWGIFQSLVGIFVIINSTARNQILMMNILISIAILFIISVLWKVEDNKERYGERKLGAIFLPIGIMTAIFLIVGIIGYIKTEKDLGEMSFMETLTSIKPNRDSIEQSEIEIYTLNQLFDKISEDFDGQRLYYKLQNKNEEGANLIIWNDIDEDVVIYVLNKEKADCYSIEFTMLSTNLKHEDVEGKEDGIILEVKN